MARPGFSRSYGQLPPRGCNGGDLGAPVYREADLEPFLPQTPELHDTGLNPEARVTRGWLADHAAGVARKTSPSTAGRTGFSPRRGWPLPARRSRHGGSAGPSLGTRTSGQRHPAPVSDGAAPARSGSGEGGSNAQAACLPLGCNPNSRCLSIPGSRTDQWFVEAIQRPCVFHSLGAVTPRGG